MFSDSYSSENIDESGFVFLLCVPTEDEYIERIAAGWLPPAFAALDFETANHRPTSACALSLLRVTGGMLGVPRTILIKPPGPFTFTWIHGICARDVADAGRFRQIWPGLCRHLDGVAFVAAHNADFDRKVLEASCNQAGLTMPPATFVCTVRLARRVWKLDRADLPSVCGHLGIPLVHHDPESDAAACARIVVAASNAGRESAESCR